jgi:hypothetical protein
MKKLLNKLGSGNNSLREDNTSSDDEEHLDAHFRKPTSLPADARDTSEDLKLKKSGSVGKGNAEVSDFSKKKSSSNGIKAPKDKDKLNESDDKALRKSGSRRRSVNKSSEVKPEGLKSPSLKSIFTSYDQQRDTGLMAGNNESDDEDSVPRSRGNSMHDDDDQFYPPVRVPSAPARISPTNVTPQRRGTSPRMESPASSSSAFSPFAASPNHVYSPPSSPYRAASPNGHVPTLLPRTMSSPPPVASQSRDVLIADDFDLRFAGSVRAHAHTEPVSEETALGTDFARERKDSVQDDVQMIDDDGELLNQKAKSGLLSFGSNKPKKLK